MALAIIRIEVPHVSGLPEETITNTLYVGSAGVIGAIEPDVRAILGTTLYAWTEDFGSSEMRWENARMITYDAADDQPRLPVFDNNAGLTAAGEANPLPPEVALCLSYRSATVSGGNRARNRGRLYFGPFNEAANVTADSTRARPNSGLITAMCDGAEAFASGLPDATWGLWSDADQAFKEIIGGYVDDAWDTQRRRGNVPTTRTEWDATP